MEKLKKLFGKTNISWKFLIIFSVILGIVPGILNRIQILGNTSFQDIAIVFDMWIILAIFIIVNCKNWKEAVLKCFIFFLISQPLIYLTEALIDTFVYNKNFIERIILYFRNYYIGAGWLMWTFLTIPGAFIAYQIKKNNVIAAIILSVATVFLGYRGSSELIKTFSNFPYHLLNSLICLVFAYLIIFIILEKKKERIISLILTTIGVIVGVIYIIIVNQTPIIVDTMISFEDGMEIVDCISDDENIAKVKLDDDKKSMTVYSSEKVGTTKIKAFGSNKEEYIYIVNSTSKDLEVELEK